MITDYTYENSDLLRIYRLYNYCLRVFINEKNTFLICKSGYEVVERLIKNLYIIFKLYN